jgi:hypothetical protein
MNENEELIGDEEEESENESLNSHKEAAAQGNREANAQERIRAANVKNLQNDHHVADPTYRTWWKRFTLLIDDQRTANQVPRGNKYCTRTNVDLFFQTVIANYASASPQHCSKAATAIQYFSDRSENVNVEPRFVVRGHVNNHVANALQTQANRYANRRIEDIQEDPHGNLPTDTLSVDDFLRVVDTIFSNNNIPWKDLGLAWNNCFATFMRLDSLRKLYLKDVRIDGSHGPVETGPNSKILSYILQPYIHKDGRPGPTGRKRQQQDGSQGNNQPNCRAKKKKNKKRVLGLYRHKNFKQCGTGMLAFNLFVRLYDNNSLSFLQVHNQRPMWQKFPLIKDWNSRSAAYQTFKSVLQSLNISWAKVTHMRTAGIENASARGELTADETATMSKHSTERIFEAYLTELFPPVMRVMAGFQKNDTYFVPRVEVAPPFTAEEMSNLVFPQISKWRQQHSSEEGDPSEAARNFLYEVLPMLARVVMQDGPYWIRDYPNHELTRLLVSRMDAGYYRWAKQTAIPEANQIADLRDIGDMERLNDATRGSYEVLARRLDIQNRLLLAIDRRTANIERLLLNRGATAEETRQEQRMERRGQIIAVEAMEPRRRRQPQAPPEAPPPQQNNVNAVLRNEPRQPPFPAAMPDTMEDILLEWEQTYNLGQYVSRQCNKSHWPQSMRQSLSRRKYLYTKIIARSENTNFRPNIEEEQQRRLEAARQFDKERSDLGLLLPQFRNYLHDSDRESGMVRSRCRRAPPVQPPERAQLQRQKQNPQARAAPRQPLLPQQIVPRQPQQPQQRFNNRGTGARYQAVLETQRQERATAILLAQQRREIVRQGGDEFDVIHEEEVKNTSRLISQGYQKGYCAVSDCANPEMELRHKCATCQRYVHVICMMQKNLLLSEEGGSDHHYCSLRCKR